MLTDPTDPSRVLIEVSDLDGGHQSHQSHQGDQGHQPARRYAEPLGRVVTWAREYLCRPHPSLGRKGPVCPYAQTSLDRGTFYLAVCPGEPDAAQVAGVLDGYRAWFRRLVAPQGVSPQFRTILVLLPDLPVDRAPEVIDAAQAALKSRYVEDGLMIGEFYPGPPPKHGLWNPDFLPLGSPVPLLAVRHMVASDFPFLKDDPRHAAAYLERFGERPPAPLREAVAAARQG